MAHQSPSPASIAAEAASYQPQPKPKPKPKPRPTPPPPPPPPVKPIINNTPIVDETPAYYTQPVVPIEDWAKPGDVIGWTNDNEKILYSPGTGALLGGKGTQESLYKSLAKSSATLPAGSFSPPADARNTIAALLETYDLGSLSNFLYDVVTRREVNIENDAALLYAIRDQPAYQQRFAGNANRRKKGLAELAPASYIGLENAYRDLLKANGLPPGFFDQNEDFQKMIENDMSPRELQDRIQLGFKEVDSANPEVLRQIQLLYPESGITGSRESLAAFFLDPVKAAPLLARQAQAAKIGAKAYETGGLQLSAKSAENVASYGYSDSQVQSAFQDLNQQAGLLNEMTGEAQLTQEEKLGAVFGTNIGAQKKINQRRDTRKAIFSSGGRGTATSGRTAGTTESGYGNAQ